MGNEQRSIDVLEVTLTDATNQLRPADRLFRVKLRNSSSMPYHVQKLSLKPPVGARLTRIVGSDILSLETEADDLRRDLALLLDGELVFSVTAEYEKRKQMAAKLVNDAIGGDTMTAARMFRLLIARGFKDWTAKILVDNFFDPLRASAVHIKSADTARDTLQQIDTDREVPSKGSGSRIVLKQKIDRLAEIEDRLEANREREGAMIVVDGSSEFEELYVVSFARGALESRRYAIGVEVEGAFAGGQTRNGKATCMSEVMPSALWISCVAALMGVVGGVLRVWVTPDQLVDRLDTAWIGGAIGLVAGFVAVNTYEIWGTDNIKILKPDFRVASLVGLACGAFWPNFFAAVKALFRIGSA